MYRRQSRLGLGLGAMGTASTNGISASGTNSAHLSLQSYSVSASLNSTNSTVTANSNPNLNISKNSILYAHQPSLKRLPVPTLKETCSRYLESVKPFTTPQSFAKTQSLVNDFIKPDGIGHVLQKRLEDRVEQEWKSGKSWLIDWWNDYAYMGYRDPVVVYVNYFFAFQDDKLRKNPAERAASIIQGALAFKDLVVSGSLEPDSTKVGPLCSEQYKYLFNATRIPVIPSDKTRLSDPLENSHIVVLRKNYFYRLDTVVNGRRLSTAELKRQLDFIYQDAGSEPCVPVGALTTENRDVWTRAREELLGFSQRNMDNFEVIETAAFAVCLDDSKPITKEEHSIACWHGDGRNRFFDKSMQFIIFDNGKAGFNGEHSNMEATITHRCCDWLLEKLAKNEINHGQDVSSSIPLPSKLSFDLSSSSVVSIQKATEQFDIIAEKHDVRVVTFEGYGKTLIKKFGVSPDAYAQMAIQLAYFKMYGVSRATYESAGTRKYKDGRTEVGRSVSVESVAWVKAMQDPSLSIIEKGQLGRAAIASQSAYMRAAGDGRGVDRHFLGLRLLLKEGEEKPSLFTDPVFVESCHWSLSTSQVTSEYYDGYGWGEVVADGYGIAYMVKNDSLQFNLCSLKLNNHHLQTFFHEALHEMKVVFEATIPQPKAKLPELPDKIESAKENSTILAGEALPSGHVKRRFLYQRWDRMIDMIHSPCS